MVFLTAFSLNNVHLLLLSGIGKPYDPATGEGVIGKNYTYQTGTSATVFFEGKNFNPFMGAGSLAMGIDDYNGDNFDHSGLDFIGGGVISQSTRERPADPVSSGAERHAALGRRLESGRREVLQLVVRLGRARQRAGLSRQLSRSRSDLQERARPAADADDVRLGQARAQVLRLARSPSTSRWRKRSTRRATTITALSEHYSVVPYQSTHNTGGAIMGTDPSKSAVNTYMQVWDVPNVFSMGASAFPQNAGYNPTGTVGALAYRTADAVTKRYIKNPGLLG